jgi:replicative DNA helicase
MNRDINLLAEARLLGNIIKQPEVWYEIATGFRPELFSDSAYRAIAQIIIDLTEGGQRPSSVKIYNEMYRRDVGLTVEDLLSVISSHVTVKETKSLLAELEDLWKRRTVYGTLLAALNELKDADKPTDEVIAYAQQVMIEAFSQTGRAELKTMQDVCEALFVRQEKVQAGEVPPTYAVNLSGLQSLVGGFESGSLNIIAARPSMGKTAFMLSEALGWAERGLPGIIFSLEQKSIQIGQRNLAAVEGIPVNFLRGKLDEKHLDKFYSGLSKLRELPIKISDKRGLTADQICSIARMEKMRNPGLKWVAVDYLTAMSFNPRQSQHLAVGDAALKLRNLAEELDVFVILLSQLNRAVEARGDKRPIMADLRDSGNLEEYADTIIFLYREGYYSPGFLDCPEGDWITEIEVAKNRQGGNAGKRTLALFEQPTMRWTICPSDLAEKYMKKVKRNG